MAYNPAICRDITRILSRVVFRFLRRQAKKFLKLKSVQLANPGLLVVIQRFGSGLNLNVHLHALGPETVRSWSKRPDLCQIDLLPGPQPTVQVPEDPPLIPSPSSVLPLYFSYPRC
jgi:hypothetical protein